MARPDQIVEVTLVALAVRLEVGNFGQNRSTIDQAYEVSCLARGMRGHPVGAVIDQHIMLVETCCAQPGACLIVNNTDRGRSNLVGQITHMVDPIR